MRLLMAGLLCCMAAQGAEALEISTRVRDGLTVYILNGSFEQGDGARFAQTAIADKALVLLESAGGNLLSGLAMGEHIRMKGYATGVLPGAICASACALAWLGGVKRFGTETSKIGFHAAATGAGAVTSSGNALIGAYLNKIGIGYRAVEYITGPQPSDMTWLSFAKARDLGIDIVALDGAEGSAPKGLGEAGHDARPEATASANIRLTCVPLAREGKDPVVAISVSRVDNYWRIVHVAASGAQYDRGEQYHITRAPGAPSWTGQHRRKSDTTMRGEISRIAGKYYYNEKVMGAGVLRGDFTARCEVE